MLFLSPNSLELPHDVNDKVLKLSKSHKSQVLLMLSLLLKY